MAIQRWDPQRDLVDLQNKMNRMFDHALSRSVGSEESEELGSAGWRPPVDLIEEPARYVLRADLPGDLIIIAADLDGSATSYEWNTAAVDAGEYRVGATVADGVNDPVALVALGLIVVTHEGGSSSGCGVTPGGARPLAAALLIVGLAAARRRRC